jgi:hypothetical protein
VLPEAEDSKKSEILISTVRCPVEKSETNTKIKFSNAPNEIYTDYLTGTAVP